MYSLSSEAAMSIGVSPLWLVRGCGAIVLGWGVAQLAASFRPDQSRVIGLVAGNMLLVATLTPALIAQKEQLMTMPIGKILLSIAVILALSAVLAILGLPHHQEKTHGKIT